MLAYTYCMYILYVHTVCTYCTYILYVRIRVQCVLGDRSLQTPKSIDRHLHTISTCVRMLFARSMSVHAD